MTELQKRLEAVMASMGWQHADLVRVSGQSSSVVSQWLGKGSKEIKTIGKIEAAQAIADATGFSALWIAKGVGPQHQMSTANADSPMSGVARSTSQLTVQTTPPIEWGEVMSTKESGALPSVFTVCIPDDSMAPRVKAGAMLLIDTRELPRPGDGVLLSDRGGALHFRQYRAGRPGAWVAHAENPAYQPLESERDGLEIIGVLMAVESRWA